MDDITRLLARIAAVESEIAQETEIPYRHPRRFQQHERRLYGAEFSAVISIAESDADRQRLTRTLHKLERAGQIVLHRPGGKRATHAKLTDAGRAEVERISQCKTA